MALLLIMKYLNITAQRKSLFLWEKSKEEMKMINATDSLINQLNECTSVKAAVIAIADLSPLSRRNLTGVRKGFRLSDNLLVALDYYGTYGGDTKYLI